VGWWVWHRPRPGTGLAMPASPGAVAPPEAPAVIVPAPDAPTLRRAA